MKKVFGKMGQQESKQKLQAITDSVNRIRKDLRNGKIKANDVERVQQILQKYSNEIDVNLAKKVRASDVYTTEQLIEITSTELDGLKQEVNLDQASISTNSFKRGFSRNSSSKEKRKSIKSITDAVDGIRQQIRSGNLRQQDYDQLHHDLANYSQQLSTMKKKNENDAAQKLISSVTQELFNTQLVQDSATLNTSTTPTASLNRSITPPLKKTEKRSSLKEQEPRKEPPKIANKNSKSTLDDIENKLEALKNDIKVAETNKDKSRLHFLSKLIQTLMTDLQLVNVQNQILSEERKGLLEKNLQRAYQQVDKIKKQITQESDIKYLTELHEKETKEKCLQELDDIQKTMMAISRNVTHQNFQAEKDTFNMYKNKLNAIEEEDQDISLKKSEVSDVMLNVENVFTRVEMEEKLNQAEWRHCQYKLDLSQFNHTPDSDAYTKHRQYLQQLRDYVGKIFEFNSKVDEKKKYVLYNIDNNIVALDQKAKENEKPKEEVVLRRAAPPKPSVTSLVATCKEIPTNCSREELRNILPILSEAKSIIDQKLSLLQSQAQKEEPDVLLVTIKEKQLQPVVNSVPPVRTQLDNIQKDVEALQLHIENSRYTKETQLYKDIKNKLESYKSYLTHLIRDNEDGGKSAENLLKYIDNVLLLLENNLGSRRSTTEDLLVDIMSVSTRVSDLGSKIKGFGRTTQDYVSIKNNLLEHRQYLKNLQISPTRTSLCKSRDDILYQIEQYLSSLQDIKKNESSGSIPEEEKQFNQELKKVKEKVYRYSGTYKNVLYKTIENDLDKYRNKADKIFKDPNLALKVKQDIENSKMILEQRSTKDQLFNVRRDSKSKELTEIRQNVESVKMELGQNRSLSREELDQLDARLTLSILALDNIKDSSREKERLYQDINIYFQQIQDLLLVSTPNPVVVEEHQLKKLDVNQVTAMTIAAIERELEEVKPQILTFVGTETSPTFLLLDEVLVRGTLKLDELNLDQTSEFYQSKMRLIRDMNKYSDILDDRINQTEEIEKLEKEVKVMLIKIDSFNGYLGDSEYTNLDEQIIILKINLGKLHVFQELIARKEACIKEVDACMKKLNEAAKTRSNGVTGTLV